MRGLRVLWVDDHHPNSSAERRLFRSLGIEIDLVEGTTEALKILAQSDHDLMISDMLRKNDPMAGQTLLMQADEQGIAVPTIFYVGSVDRRRGVPVKAFAITDRPDELLHYVIDIAERRDLLLSY